MLLNIETVAALPAPSTPAPAALPSLDELAVKWGTDKRIGIHSYTRWYEAMFEPRRLEAINVLEIGVQGGCSIRMWEEYFPNARIVGMDIDPRCAALAGDRVEIVIGSQTDAAVAAALRQRFPDGFDIIIDDGSHVGEHQQATFALYLDALLRPGGSYIIEDLHCGYRENFRGNSPQTIMQFLKDRVDDVMINGDTGIGDYAETCRWLETNNVRPLRPYERLVESITFVQSMAMITKRAA